MQFHPEVTHTKQGAAILARFAHDICGCGYDWNMADYAGEAIAQIRAQVGADEVILGLSGGVDSSVAAALIHKAIGAQLTCVFVDHGLLRLNEAEQVMDTFARNLGVRVDPRRRGRRDVRGARRRRRSRAEAPDHRPALRRRVPARGGQAAEVKWLAQGTIYPDVIESAGAKTKKAHTIKSHHNVGGLPETLHLKLSSRCASSSRTRCASSGSRSACRARWSVGTRSPGPGSACGSWAPSRASMRDSCAAPTRSSSTSCARRATPSGKSWYDLTAQAFAVFLPVRSVGVMGDGRTYEHVVALRAVQTTDFMTAHAAPLPHELLAKVSNRIINEVRGINRVTLDISSKPPATIEWE